MVEYLEGRVLLTAPTVASTTPNILVNQTALTAGVKSLKIVYSTPVLGGNNVSNYDLRNLGPDGLSGTADDVVIPLTATYSGSTATLSFSTLPANRNYYELTIFDTITDTSNNPLNGNGFSPSNFVRDFTIVPSTATTLTVNGYSSPATAGISNNITVAALDQYGNVATGYTGTVHFTSSDTAASLPVDYTFTAGDAGIHTFSATLFSTGSKSITATDAITSTITGKESGITVTAAPASKFTVTTSTVATAGTPLMVTVTAKDPYSNIATGYTGTVHFTSTDTLALLPVDYAFTAADAGVHTFTVTLETAGSRTITVTDTVSGTITGKQSSIQVIPATTGYFVVASASTATAGVAFVVTVTAKDPYGNVATGYTGTVHFTSTDALALLPGDYTFTAADAGMHTFNVTLETAGSRTITVTDTANGTITGKQSALQVSATVANHFVVTTPSSVVAGVPFSVTVTAKDPYANIATGYTGIINFTSTDPLSVLPANYTFVVADSGVQIFTVTLNSVGSKTIAATDVGNATITGKQSGILVTTASSASQFVVASSTSAIAGTPFSVTVTAEDPFGNVSSGYAGTVHFTSSDTAALLPIDYTFVAADAGSHTFTVILYTAGSRSITVTDTGNTTVTGKQPAVQVAGAAATYFIATAPASVSSGTPIEFTFSAKDAYGNLTANYTGTVTFTSSDQEVVLPTDYTFTSADAGQHTFTVTFFTPGIMNLVATDIANPTITGKQSTNVLGGAYLYLASTNTIYINDVTATLTTIQSNLPSAPLALVDPVNHIWLLDANILVVNGGTLDLSGTSIGGDVNQLRMRSDNYKLANGWDNPTNSVAIQARYGNIEINTTSITSWDEAINGPDTNPGFVPTFGDDIPDSTPPAGSHIRANISVRSFFAADGVTPLDSRMDVLNSDIGYLGSHATEAYGLVWKALGIGPVVHSALQVYGNVENNHIHNMMFGVYTYGAFGMQILNNEVNNDIWYGLDPHDDSNNMVIEGNILHDNGTHGLIMSERCDNAIINNNISYNNGLQGIMLHRSSDNDLVENNTSYDNGGDGIAVFEGFNDTITNNVIYNNQRGVRFNVGSSNNTISDNQIYANAVAGIYFFQGNDTPTVNNGRPSNNLIIGNTIHDDQQYAVELANSDNNTFQGNTIYSDNSLLFKSSLKNIIGGNTIPADAIIQTVGSAAFPSNTIIQNEPSFLVQVDSYSTEALGDSSGTIFDVGSGGVPTSVTSAGSSLVLSQATIGLSPVLVNSRSLDVSVSAQQALITPTIWASGGVPLRAWTTQAGSTTQTITFTVGNLAPNASYAVTRNNAFLTSQQADGTGTISFTDVPGTTATVTYALAGSNKPTFPPAQAANVSYSSKTNTITVSGAVSVTLTQLKSLLPAAPLTLVGTNPDIWYLQANLTLSQGAGLVLTGSAIGGDVDQLRLQSNNVANGAIKVIANYGDIYADTTAITSWDSAANGPDTETATYQRAQISVVSVDATHLSRMDVDRSDIGYLGYNSTNSGLTWNTGSSIVPVLGSVYASTIHNNYYGISLNMATNLLALTNNQIVQNLNNGINVNVSTGCDFEGNTIANNGAAGINISGSSTAITVGTSTLQNNATNGITVQGGAGSITIDNNQVNQNVKYGIELITSNNNTLRANTVQQSPTGILLTAGSDRNTLDSNVVGSTTASAINLSGSGTTPLGFVGNLLVNNAIQNNSGYALSISSLDDTTVDSNILTGNSKVPSIQITTSNNTRFTGNTFSATDVIKTSGNSTFATQVFITNESKVMVQVDSFSSVEFQDATGTVYKPGNFVIATTETPSYSQLILNSAEIGTNAVLVTARHLSASVDSGSALLFTSLSTWDTTGTGTKIWTTTADSTAQTLTYTVGDCLPGANYNVVKNGTLLYTLQADALGNIYFADVAGSLGAVTYSVMPA
jgi:parallel beta-helix repeat protein